MERDNPDLEHLRVMLQECDLKIMMMLQERFGLASRLGLLKRAMDLEPFQESEWQRKILLLGSYLEEHPHAEPILRIFHAIHTESVGMQQGLTG